MQSADSSDVPGRQALGDSGDRCLGRTSDPNSAPLKGQHGDPEAAKQRAGEVKAHSTPSTICAICLAATRSPESTTQFCSVLN